MIMADILFWIAIAIGVLATLIAHWLAARALLPATVTRCSEAYHRRPLACCVIGVLVTLPLVLILLGAVDKIPFPLAKMLLIGVLCVPLVIGLIGSAGLAQRIGMGLPAPADLERPWLPVLRGSVVMGLCFIAPILGWFIFLPLTLLSGVGAWLLARRLEV
jgi:hypothetical protein